MKPTAFRHLFAAGTAALAVFAAAPAFGYGAMVVLGDSLSDSGNNSILLGGATTPYSAITTNSFIPTYPYASSAAYPVYSNGPVWATSFASMLGLSANPSLAGGTNYAFGGAQTSVNTVPSLTAQTGLFLSDHGGAAPGNYLYVVEGGGNNARAALAAIAADPSKTFAIIGAAAYQYATDIGNIVDTLQAAGARDIVVWNTPNLGTAPAVLAQGSFAAGLATSVAQAMNGALGLRLSGETGVTTFDLFGSVAGIIANPSAYGLSNVTDACIMGACNASEYLFWDGIHPTARGHELLADAMYAALIPEPQTYLLFAIGLAALAWRRRTD